MAGKSRKKPPYLSGIVCRTRAKNGYKKDPCGESEEEDQGPSSFKLASLTPAAFSRGVGGSRNHRPRAKADSPLSVQFPPVQKYILNSAGEGLRIDQRAKSIFRTCCQALPIPLGTVVNNLKNVRKVGEGVFGEVFVGKFGSIRKPRIFKIVAIEGRKIVNDQVQRKFEQIESEIIVSQYLNKLYVGYNGCYTEGFVFMHNARICQGKYPQKLVKAWDTFKKYHQCENDKPDYCRGQLYAVFEYDYVGVDICRFPFRTYKQSLAVVLQVAHALAVAEVACNFEHRDLHWGNVLLEHTRDLYNIYTIQDRTYKVPSCGLSAKIIDFTISRVTADDGRDVYFDLANDEEQFSGPDKLQFGVYKKMRKITKNVWSKYTPKSNVLWVHYLVCKFLSHVTFTDIAADEHHEFNQHMEKLRTGLTKYNSCAELAHKFLRKFVRRLEDD